MRKKFFVELREWCDFYLHDYLLTDTGNSEILLDLFSPLPRCKLNSQPAFAAPGYHRQPELQLLALCAHRHSRGHCAIFKIELLST